jgi:chromosome partitioning protein
MIIAIANQKGGVGKTTTAVTLAAGLALKGHSVLIVDLDVQGNVADALGMESGGELCTWLWREVPIGHVVHTGRDNLGVIRGDKTTVMLKQGLAGRDFREMVLVEALSGCGYEYVVLDCAPSVDVLHTAALVAANKLIVPTKLDQFAVKGVVETLHSLAAVRKASRGSCELAGIVPTFYDRTTNETQAQLENLVGGFPAHVWPVVPVDTACRVANRQGVTLWEYAGKSRAREAYELIVRRVEEL